MRDNPGGGELDPAEGIRRRCKKNSLKENSLLCLRATLAIASFRVWYARATSFFCDEYA